MGYSIGHWEGDTLVVETAGLDERGWLDLNGHPQTEMTHITECYRRDFGHMDLQLIIEDPNASGPQLFCRLGHDREHVREREGLFAPGRSWQGFKISRADSSNLHMRRGPPLQRCHVAAITLRTGFRGPVVV
jgi:hypothetical protein